MLRSIILKHKNMFKEQSLIYLNFNNFTTKSEVICKQEKCEYDNYEKSCKKENCKNNLNDKKELENNPYNDRED